MVGRGPGSSQDPIHKASTPMTNHLFQVPPPNTITSGIRFKQMNLGGQGQTLSLQHWEWEFLAVLASLVGITESIPCFSPRLRRREVPQSLEGAPEAGQWGGGRGGRHVRIQLSKTVSPNMPTYSPGTRRMADAPPAATAIV